MKTARFPLTRPQIEFLKCEAQYPAFVGGFGSGKSAAMVVASISDAAQSASALVGVYEPTFDLLNTIAMPRISAMLTLMGVPHKLNKVEKAIYTNYPRFGDFLFRSMENPDTLVGYETFGAHCDELDTLKPAKAETVWQKVIARNRQKAGGGAPNRARVYTTPEGFGFVHRRWVAEANEQYQITRAPTYSNPYLPPEYVENLRASYPEQLIAAYIEGEFVNLKSGTVYNAYDRAACRSIEAIRPNEPLFVGADFNVANMASAIAVKRPNGLHIVEQLVGIYDTPALIETLQDRYEGHKIAIYPDASGGSRKTVNASISDIALLKRAGFRVVVDASNPAVRDRIVSVNSGFSHGKLWVNDRTAPEVARCLEQQAYGKNGEPDKEGGFDHMVDAVGYLAVKEMPVRKPVSRAKLIGL